LPHLCSLQARRDSARAPVSRVGCLRCGRLRVREVQPVSPEVYAMLYIGGLVMLVVVVVETSRWIAKRRKR
jgi:hypothetical protein